LVGKDLIMVGIYMIENKVNGKRYVGQSKDIEARWNYHKYYEYNNHLKSAFKKYGLVNFELKILCELKENEQSKERLNDLEIAYIDILETTNPDKGYNQTFGGVGGKKTQEVNAKIRASSVGKKLSEETKAKLRVAAKGRNIGKKLSEETKSKMSTSHKGKPAWWCKGKPSPLKGKKGHPAWNKGKKGKSPTVEARTRMRASRFGYIADFELEEPQKKVFIGEY